ncbi:proclotting enzyme-like [Palaemon carinicauda]|uniref:proclotting enzyme-like n=1 Tax=Palaemon carinicauda TaxID=392227 RepID=UPI0035B5A3B5
MKSIIFLFGFSILEITAKSAARYYCNPLACGNAYVSMGYNTQYYFSSPGYPNPYPTGTECLWSIVSPYSTALRLQCYFDTTPSSDCNSDPFFFSPSGDCWMNDGRVYCGFGYLDVTTQYNYLAVRFYSFASNINHQGFSCLVSVINPIGINELLTPDPNPPAGPSSLTSPFVTSTTSTPETYSEENSSITPFVTNSHIFSSLTSSTTLLKTSDASGTMMPPTSSGTMPPTSSGTMPPRSSGVSHPTTTPDVSDPPTPAANATTDPATNAPTGIPNNSSCECGIKGTSRIVGGNEAEPLEWPWQAGLLRSIGGSTFCGGSLISDQWVVTAAHCVDGMSASQLQVILGDHDTTVVETTELTLSVDNIIIHSGYDSNTVDNDIALLHLQTSVGPFADERIMPICLPGNYISEDFIQEIATVTGWGTLQFQGVQSSVLMEVDLPIVDCQNFEIIADDVTNNMICAYEEGKDSCQGDSGGPLQLQLDGKYHLAGLVSFGHGCGDLNSPGVYTKVTNYIDWIENNTGETFCY